MQEQDWATYETAEFATDLGNNASRAHPIHDTGYNGIWSLRPNDWPDNIFFEEEGFGQNRGISGMNLEHYFDGATDMSAPGVLFDPRYSPMTFERPSPNEAVLRQPPTKVFQVESVTRFKVVDPHYVDFEFECIARRDFFPHDYLGVFWANYMNKPEDPVIHFRGYRTPEQEEAEWITTVGGPYYGREAVLGPAPAEESLRGAAMFSRGSFDWAEPHFYGVLHGYLFLLMFDCDLPLAIYAGGSPGVPATGWCPWDFQILIPEPQVGQAYGLRARLCVTKFQSHEQAEAEITAWNQLCEQRKQQNS